MSFGGINNGGSSISTSSDVALNNPSDGQVLTYDASLQKWQNKGIGNGFSQPLTIVTSAPYSADNSGTNDARAAIQQAIDDVSAAGGGVVFLPAGKYRIEFLANGLGAGQGCGLQLKDSVILAGEGFASMLFPTGSWAQEAGIVGIGNFATTAAVRDAQVRDLFIKGSDSTSGHVTPTSNRSGILFNTNAITTEPDAVHRITNIWIWDCDRGLVLMGDDDQAVVVNTVRIRWSLRQGVLTGREDGSGGGPDNFLTFVDVSSSNLGGGTYAGFEIWSSNVHLNTCKSWYNKRSTAFTTGVTYKDGAGFYLAATRIFGSNLEAQDNGGHGVLIRYGNVNIEGLIADSNSYYANVSGSAVTNECYGLYIGSGVASATVSGINVFSRSASHQDQKYGVYIDSSSRNIQLSGTAKDNASVQNTPTAADAVVWSSGANASHLVAIGVSAGGTSSVVTNGYASSSTGPYTGFKSTVGQEVTVTGTTLTSDANVKADVPGGGLRYSIEGTIIYHADATQKAKLTLLPTVVSGSGTLDGYIQLTYTDMTGASKISPVYLNGSGSTAITADGAGNDTQTTTTRMVRITGSCYVATTITTGRLSLAVAEANGTGTGIKVNTGSWLRLTLLG